MIRMNFYFHLLKNKFSFFRAGGIELYAVGRKIKISNTIEARLTTIFNQILPEIRGKLFGVNQNRKYYD